MIATVYESRRWRVPIPERGPVLDHHLTGHTLIAERATLAEAKADVRALGPRRGFVLERHIEVAGPVLGGIPESYGGDWRDAHERFAREERCFTSRLAQSFERSGELV